MKKTVAKRSGAAKKKAPARKKASTKKKFPATGKGPAKRKASAKTKVPARTSTAKAPAAKRTKHAPAIAPSVTAVQVNLGHIFALRPRVQVSFNPESLREALRLLAAEKYASLDEAARAVAAKAVELSNARSGKDPFQRR